MKLKGNDVKIGGMFKVTLRDKNGNIKYDGTPFHNLILNGWFDDLYVWPNNSVHIAVGIGTTPPLVTDNALENEIARGIQTVGGSGPIPVINETEAYADRIMVRTFSIGEVEGNIAEVGISFRANSTMHVRSLIKDAQGNPTVIPVLATDQLTVEYTMRTVYDRTDVVNVIDVNGTPTTVTQRLGEPGGLYFTYTFSTGRFYEFFTLEPIGESGIRGGDSYPLAVVHSKIASGLHQCTYNAATNQANFTSGIQGISGFDGSYAGTGYQTLFDPPLPKTDKDIMNITFQKQYVRA